MTTEFIINHILTTYKYGEDIGQALEEECEALTDTWVPDLQKSTNMDPAAKAKDDEEFKMLWKAKLDEYMRRKCTYKNFKGTILQNPIKLLKAIKEHLQNYQENCYSMCIILDAVMALVLYKQKENESLQDYTKRFCVVRDVFESHLGGPIVLHKIVTAMPRYDKSSILKCDDKRKTASDYGSLLDGLNTQQSLNNNQYLATITDANNVLSNHCFDNNKSNKQDEKTDKKSKSDNNVKKEEQEVPLSFAQLEGKCYCCGKPGHKLSQCCEKDSKRHEEWFIHKARSHMQASGNADAASEGSNKSNDTKSNQGTSTRNVR